MENVVITDIINSMMNKWVRSAPESQVKNNMNTQDRRSYNLMILTELKKIVEMYPDLRFGQMIEVFCKGNSDLFYDEPDLTLSRIKENLNKYGI